jgi:hypothetical protein
VVPLLLIMVDLDCLFHLELELEPHEASLHYCNTPCFCSVVICANDLLTTPLTTLGNPRSTHGQNTSLKP